MGLYQYIREQAHRNDPIGELGRWMSKHYGERPDQTSLAFKTASEEFAACGNWTRQDAVKRLNSNEEIKRIVKIEPGVSGIVSEILRIRATQGYNRDREYRNFKAKIRELVGDEAKKDEVANSNSYDVMIQVIADLLPPDKVDLYPNGLPEHENLALDL